MIEIFSAQNPRYKSWLKLLDGRGVRKHELALVFGRKFIVEILAAFPHRASGVIVTREGDAAKLALPEGCPVYLLSGELYAALDIYGIREPILIITALPPPAWSGELPVGLTVFLPFQNPINLGTTIRSAAAFGASVVLLREAATPYLPKALRASGPAVFQVPLFQGPGLEELSALNHPRLHALSPRGKDLFTFDFPERLGLVAGLEGPGLDTFWAVEKRLSIPMLPQVESLNASVAMSIAMAFYLADRG